MGKTVKKEKSDDIEIVSIGRLYSGPWDKKYWSSSRGKDRYPYPVGYKSLRTQNGITCTMEILEGRKGPSFMISSTDGKSCSGDTPDIAWEKFQKKGCSKLWHGKRFSCKIDGVEFFGFKNTFVQRLLRELVANVGGTAEQNLLPLNFSTGAGEPIDQLQSRASSPDSDFPKFLSTSRVTGKRSRRDNNYKNEQLNETHLQYQQEKCLKNVNASNSLQSDQSVSGYGDPSTSATVSEAHNIPAVSQPENIAAGVEDDKHLSNADRSMQVDSLCISNHLELENVFPREDRGPTWSLNHLGSNVNSLLLQPEPGHRSRDVREYTLIPQERGGMNNVEQDLPAFDDDDLCAPDTLDHDGDSTFVSSFENDAQVHLTVKDAATNDVAKCEFLVSDSSPEDETSGSAYNSSVEKCDTDSVGQDIAKSMITVLLPRALPLLKTFSRRKQNAKPPKPLSHGSQEVNKIPNITVTDAIIAEELAEHSYPERKKEYTVIPCAKSPVSTSVNTISVVPDSFDNDDPQDLLNHADTAKADQASCNLNNHIQLPTSGNSEANWLLCHARIKKPDSGISDVMIEDTTDNVLAPVEEIPTNSKSAMDNLSSINAPLIGVTSRSKCIMARSSSDLCIPENCEAGFAKLPKDTEFSECDHSSSMMEIPGASHYSSMVGNKMNDDSRSNDQQQMKLNSYPTCIPKLFACYVHPMPISMVQLVVKVKEIFICVTYGYSEHKESMLFIYKAIKYGENMGCPSLSGYMPIVMQISTSAHGRDIAIERSLIQFTPDAQAIVLLNSIKTPYCREGKIHCPCPACTSDYSEKNAVKIVKLNSGYASLVTRLETIQGVCCLLVCEPSFLLAAEEGGKLKLWVMNCGWSGQVEDWYLPTFDCMFPSIVDLKSIPKSADLVVGHNGFGEFALWDIKTRNLVSRFSSPGISVVECMPASIFRWQIKAECKREVLIDEIMNATNTWHSGSNENCIFSPDKDAAVWLLISTVSDSDSQCYRTCEQETACWRLALLINNKVILGSTVDGSAASVTFDGHGIIGGCDGLIHVWELTTGKKLETLHSLRGRSVSCIATDASNLGALAIATGDQLMLYLSS